ncbi:hypothetical protein OEZ71_15060 [Defluviimonas sp. WL0050]|uniref:Anti-sigma factor n=1 Tax=Albidovulum litorale TaxID=2984134 RepID=A0ABT2ZR33_9RHOB|nr:hypothetical protein [Defluviimonas sp. WL0050]MCV2873620.1 hypothetical protein [Defluviimonas sp. WL0050]
MIDRNDRERRVAELLPFYVNETLSSEERAEVEALLAADVGLRAQVDLLRHIRATIKAEEMNYSPGDLGLARLMQAVEPKRRPFRLLAASVAAVSVVAGATLYLSHADRVPVYEQAGIAAAQGELFVAFRPDAPQGAISDLLLVHDLTIVDGPSALGLYRVLVPEVTSAADVIAALEEAAELVESAGAAE